MSKNTNKEIRDFLIEEFQAAIDQMLSNLSIMTDSKGHRRINGGSAQPISETLRLDRKSPVRISKNGDIAATIRVPKDGHAYFVDQGVRGTKSSYPASMGSPYQMRTMPPMYKILNWMAHRGIGSGLSANKKKKLAWNIARKIRDKGIEGVPFMSSVLDNAFTKRLLDGINKRASEGTKNDMDDYIMKGMYVDPRTSKLTFKFEKLGDL